MTKPTYEDALAFIQDELGIKLYDYQKVLLQHWYDGKEVHFLPARHNPRTDMLGYIAIAMLKRKENENESN